MILGHVTTTTCLHQGLKNIGVNLPYLPFLLGALFPDLIDKPLALMTDLPGRFSGHSIPVLTVVFIVLRIVLHEKRELAYAFFAGTLLHLVQDIPIDVNTALWPLWGPVEYTQSAGLFVNVRRFYMDINMPIQWTIEMISFPWCLAIFMNCRKSLLIPAPLSSKS
jgi:hypothetical protein